MSITIVAKRAGVSSSTVSRVINQHPRVAPDTARTVRKVMAEMGYVPSDRRPGPKPRLRAQTQIKHIAFLKLGASRQGLTPGLEELLHGVSEAARKLHVTLSLCHIPDPREVPHRIFDMPTEGVLLHGAYPSPEVRKLLQGVPTVWLMGNRHRPDWGDQVMPDGAQIGRLAAFYLLGLGHRRLAFLNMDRGHWPFRTYFQAFLATAEEHGAQVNCLHGPMPAAREYWYPYDQAAADAIADQFVQLQPRPTGLFIADDLQAAMIQPALQRRGVTLATAPESQALHVISCNKEDPFLVGLHPRPASIDIRIESIGRKGVDHLLWRAQHPDFPDRIVTLIEPRLISRDGKVIQVEEPEHSTPAGA